MFKQATVVGQLEHDVQHARLGVVELQDARQQGRAHFAHGGAHRVAQRAVQVPEDRGAAGRRVVGHADFLRALQQGLGARAGYGQAGDVALHVGQEHRHADAREAFGQGHQGHGLARARRAGHQAMAVAQFRLQGDGDIVGDAFAEQDRIHGQLALWTGYVNGQDSKRRRVSAT